MRAASYISHSKVHAQRDLLKPRRNQNAAVAISTNSVDSIGWSSEACRHVTRPLHHYSSFFVIINTIDRGSLGDLRLQYSYYNIKTLIRLQRNFNIGAMDGTPNCTSLQSLGVFNEYLEQLRYETNFVESNLAQCRKEICLAIWGGRNSDISGIAVRRYITIIRPLSSRLTYINRF